MRYLRQILPGGRSIEEKLLILHRQLGEVWRLAEEIKADLNHDDNRFLAIASITSSLRISAMQAELILANLED
jgi:hypothetical protein